MQSKLITKIKQTFHDKEKRLSLLIVLIGFALFFIFYLNSYIHGDQLGLWSYISSHDHQNPFSLWNWQASGGAPQSLNPEYSFLDVSYFTTLLFKDIILRSNIINALHILILGIGGFILANHLTKNFQASLIGAVLGTLSGMGIKSIGNNPYFFAMAYFPIILYFFIKILENPNYKNSFFLAFFFTLVVLSGGIGTILWLLFYIPIFLLIYFIIFFDKNKIKKQIVFLALALVMLSLFSLFKLWSGFVYIEDAGSRAGVQPFDLFVQGTGSPAEIFERIKSFIIPTETVDYRALWIGPIGAVLILFSFKNIKKKHYLLFFIIFVVAVLLSSNFLITKIAHKVPYLNRTKDVVKGLFIYSVAIGIMASFGYISLQNKIKNKNLQKFLPQIVLTLIFIQTLIFFVALNDSNLSYRGGIGKIIREDKFFEGLEKGEFRISYKDFTGGIAQIRISEENIETSDWISGNGFSIPYATFKEVAKQANTEKLLGLLNVKYIYSKEQLNLPLVKKDEINSDYLYENKYFLPRYRTTEKSWLIVDNKNKQATYSVLAHPKYNPKSTTIITKYEIPDNLENFEVIMLTKSPTQQEITMLENFANKGGTIFPDIFNRNGNLTPEFILENELKTTEEIKAFERLKDKLKIKVSQPGWIILSDTFSIWSGWIAEQNGKEIKIYNTNGVNSAVYAGAGEVEFRYRPKSFYLGGIISLISFLIALIFFITKKEHN